MNNNIQVLFSAMYQKDMNLPARAGVKTNSLVINQTDFNKFPNLNCNAANMFFFSTEERGLSKSRNKALEKASGDICIIADEDVFYVDGYEKIVMNAFEKYVDADIILFDILDRDNDAKRKKVAPKDGKLNKLQILRGNSIRITFKLESVKTAGIGFNTLFGSGSNCFIASEDIVFLVDCMRKGLKIYYVSMPIVGIIPKKSSWFTGYNEQYFMTIGAFSLHFMGNLYFLYILQFLIRHRNLLQKMPFHTAMKYCMEGASKYRSLRKLHKLNTHQ